MQTNVNIKIYKISAIVLAVFSVLAPAFGTYADDYSNDYSSNDYYNSYSNDYSNSYSSNDYYNNYSGSNDYYNSYTAPNNDYYNSYSTPTYDYYTTDTPSSYDYYSTDSYYSTPTYSTGCTSGCGGSSYYTPYVPPVYYPPVNRGCTSNCNPIAQNTVVSGSCAGIPSTATVGQSVTWSANGSGGNGNYTYSWGGAATGAGQTVTNTYNSAGTQTATVAITSGGQTVTRTCSVYVQQPYIPPVQNNLSVSCYANNTNPLVGQTVTFNANRPTKFLLSSVIISMPLNVVTTGMLQEANKVSNSFRAPEIRIPCPARITGRLACFIFSAINRIVNEISELIPGAGGINGQRFSSSTKAP